MTTVADATWVINVLILVLMEYALEVIVVVMLLVNNEDVLILVLMEYALEVYIY